MLRILWAGQTFCNALILPICADKKNQRGASFKIGSVNINAKAMLQATSDLEPLGEVMPTNKADRSKYEINFYAKTAHFDCPWDRTDDSALLRGVYEYGIGSWEAIKMDPDLKLQDKILPDGDLKPQVKHLQSRADYLLRSLKRRVEGDQQIKDAEVCILLIRCMKSFPSLPFLYYILVFIAPSCF